MSSTGQGKVNGQGDRAPVHHGAGVGATAPPNASASKNSAATKNNKPGAHGNGSSDDGDSSEAIVMKLEDEIMHGFIPRGPGYKPATGSTKGPTRVVTASLNPPPPSSQRGLSSNVSSRRPAATTSNQRTTAGNKRPS